MQDIFLTATAEMADVVFPAAAGWCESEGTVTNSERRVQRVRKALDPPGGRQGRHLPSSSISRAAWDTTGESRMPRRSGTKCARSAPPHAGMSYARLEADHGLQWPCYDENHPGELFLHSRLWERPLNGPRVAFQPVEHDPPVERLTDEFPLRLTTGRRLDEYNTGVQTSGYASPLRRGESLDISPEDAERLGVRNGEVVRVSSRRGANRGAGADRRGPASRAHVHDAPLPGRGRHQYPDDRRHGPQVGDRGIQGRRHPGRAAGSHVRQWTFTFMAPKPTAAEQAAVDSVLGPPTSAWAGGPRNVEEEGHSSLAGRPRGPIPPRPASARAPCRPVALRLGAAGRPRLYLPAPDGAARRGARRRHLLSSLLARAAPLAVAHVCDDIACRIKGAERLCAELEQSLGPESEEAAGNAARAWAVANRPPPRWS